MVLINPLHHNHAAYAVYMPTSQLDGLVRDAEADRTEVIMQLRNDSNNFLGNFEAHGLRHPT